MDQRNKQSEQLRENKRLSVAVTASSSPQQSRAQPLAKVVSQRSLTNMTPPTPSRRYISFSNQYSNFIRNIATRQQMSRLGTPETPESSKYYQILLDMKVFMCSVSRPHFLIIFDRLESQAKFDFLFIMQTIKNSLLRNSKSLSLHMECLKMFPKLEKSKQFLG